MSLMAELLRDQLIQDVLVDSEVVYIMLNNGTQITIHGVVVVEPKLWGCIRPLRLQTDERDKEAPERNSSYDPLTAPG
jgi:hypothetical protein